MENNIGDQQTILKHSEDYRKDIDGLRAAAVLPVIAFHSDFMPNGYLGVDVFFVISGFLITGILYEKLIGGNFSLTEFYVRRIRRIVPLSLFVTASCLFLGIFVMLPDDLENLAQSAFATNVFANNILLAITSRDYWDVVNEYKPLLHTWSLGIEEQYYLIYPFLFLLVSKKRLNWLVPLLVALAVISMSMLFMSFADSQKFYFIQFRFFELAVGGIAAICLRNRVIDYNFSWAFLLALIFLLVFPLELYSKHLALVTTVLLTLCVLMSSNSNSRLSSLILENRVSVGIGVISFSLYMWHQPVLAFARYIWIPEVQIPHLLLLYALIGMLSLASYQFVEQPFRNRNRINTHFLLISVIVVFIMTSAASLFIYQKAGVLKDVPELGISRAQATRKMHAAYNDRILEYDRDFDSEEQLRVLIIGNSLARDWANVLIESKFGPSLEVSYIHFPHRHPSLKRRVDEADVVFWSTQVNNATPTRAQVRELEISEQNLWIVGAKNFGKNNGYFYNYSGDDRLAQRTLMQTGVSEINEILKFIWQDKFIDYVGHIIDEESMVPVFTPTGRFISQDTIHLTQAGALYFGQVFEAELEQLLVASRQ